MFVISSDDARDRKLPTDQNKCETNRFLNNDLFTENSPKKEYYNLEIQRQKKKNISFSFREIIIKEICGCCVKKKIQKMKFDLYEKANEKLSEMFEITYVMRKMEEMEKLKIILFDKPQSSAFNLCSAEMCSLDPHRLNSSFLDQIKSFQKDPVKLNEMIDLFLTGNKHDPMDKKLFKLLRKRFQKQRKITFNISSD